MKKASLRVSDSLLSLSQVSANKISGTPSCHPHHRWIEICMEIGYLPFVLPLTEHLDLQRLNPKAEMWPKSCGPLFFSWVQNKINGNGKQGNGQPQSTVPPSKYHHSKQDSREEFNDWPHGLLAIGTFGNTDPKENQNQNRQDTHEDPPLSPDLSDFTPEEVGKLQKELTKLLTRKPSSKREQSDLPLDRFLNCPSSLEVDRRISNSVSSAFDDRDQEIEWTISAIIHKCKEICADNSKKSIGKKSMSFLLKKMFVCSSGFSLAPSLRDPLPESRMEKLLRTIIRKTMYPQNASRTSSMKKYIENRTSEQDDEQKDKISDGSKWVKTDSDYIVLEI